MKKQILVLLFSNLFLLIVYPASAMALDSSFTSGGTNYVIYDAQAVAGSEVGWVISNNPNFSIISNQIGEFCRAGQKKIALTLYFTSSGLGKEDRTYGVNSAGGTLPVWTTNVIRGILERVIIQKDKYANPCFNELQFRFRPLGRVYTDPKEWEIWNEQGYLDNRSFIFNTRDLVKAIIGNAPISVFFDLGVEQGGEDVGQNVPYLKKLWKDYTDKYGSGDTYGFSMAWGPGTLSKLVEIYDAVGVRPSQYAVDVYESTNATLNMLQQLQVMYLEMRLAGEQNKPILIQETYYNDQKAYEEILSAITQGIPIRAVMQWQVGRDMHPVVGPSYIYLPPTKTADLNGDAKIDIFDYNLLVEEYKNPYTLTDYDNVVANFGK